MLIFKLNDIKNNTLKSILIYYSLFQLIRNFLINPWNKINKQRSLTGIVKKPLTS